MSGHYWKRRAMIRIDRQANEWLVRLAGDSLDADDLENFSRWLAEDSRHENAFHRASLVWENVPPQAAALLTDRGADLPLIRRIADFISLPRRPAFAAVAVMVVLAVTLSLGIVIFPAMHGDSSSYDQSNYVTTARGEQKFMTMVDGSSIAINTESALSFHYTDNARLVSLQSGEAYFSVRKDPFRPFVVQTPNGMVRALGTEFNINIDGMETSTTVIEGRVEVKHDSIGSHGVVRQILLAGETVSNSGTSGAGEVHNIDVDQAASWRFGRITFDSSPLELVVREMNRYRDHQIVIADPELKRKPVTGSFRVAETDDFLLTLEELKIARVITRPNDVVLISNK